MIIDDTNFSDEYPSICAAIEASDFTSIDLEFSGLVVNADGRSEYLDTYEKRYTRIRQTACAFAVLQCGLACFTWSTERNAYLPKVFTFSVFQRLDTASLPRTLLKARADECVGDVFRCQASSMSFLASNNFDFAKCFQHGLPYLNRDQEQRIRAKLDISLEDKDVLIACEDEEFVKAFLYYLVGLFLSI